MADIYVLLQCVKQASKLRVKMISSYPFPAGLNCQFPRNIRQDGMYYVVRADDVRLRGNFYSIPKDKVIKQTFNIDELKTYINTLPHNEANKKITISKIFGEDEDNECNVCMTNNKDVVFAPCGHFSCCNSCALQCQKCPICRGKIDSIVQYSSLKNDE